MLSFDANQVHQSLSMHQCIGVIEDLYRNEGDSINVQPLKNVVRVDPDSVFLTMPAYSKKLERFGVKIVTELKNNPAKYSLPVQGGLILLMDGRNSELLATLDAPMITAIRTGAVSGVATKLLARKDSKIAGVVGSGQQAVTQLEAVCAVRNISKARVHSRNRSNAQKFVTEVSKSLGLDIEAKESRRETLNNADVAIVATNSSVPVLDWSEIPVGCHINSIGTLPERRELDLETVCNSRLFVDSKAAVLNEAGDVMHAISLGRISKNHIVGDLSDLLLGRSRGRRDDNDVTLFKSVGFALQDVYASSFVYDLQKSR